MLCPKPLRKMGLHEFYLALSFTEKELLYDCTRYLDDVRITAAQFLWMGAANLIPHGHYPLASKMLLNALPLAKNTEDLAHIHANLAQLYFDQLDTLPGKAPICLHHCARTLATGYFTRWARDMVHQVTAQLEAAAHFNAQPKEEKRTPKM